MKDKIKKIPNHVWFLVTGLIVGLLSIYLTVYVFDFNLITVTVPWNKGNNVIKGFNSKIFLLLPMILLLGVFLLRKKLSSGSKNAQDFLIITLGLIAIFWELLHDVSAIHFRFADQTANFKMYQQFILGFSLCRMNTYIIGTFLIFRKIDMVKWVAATSLFGGIVSLVGEYDNTANLHSLITHSVILTVFPALAISTNKTTYTVRNLIHAFIFNLTLVGVMLIVNYTVNNGWDVVKVQHKVHAIAGELTRTNMANNDLVGFLPWPFNMVLWIIAVMMLEVIYYFAQRIVVWRTYNRDTKLKEIYSLEYKKDKPEWYGFKLWGSNGKLHKNTQ